MTYKTENTQKAFFFLGEGLDGRYLQVGKRVHDFGWNGTSLLGKDYHTIDEVRREIELLRSKDDGMLESLIIIEKILTRQRSPHTRINVLYPVTVVSSTDTRVQTMLTCAGFCEIPKNVTIY